MKALPAGEETKDFQVGDRIRVKRCHPEYSGLTGVVTRVGEWTVDMLDAEGDTTPWDRSSIELDPTPPAAGDEGDVAWARKYLWSVLGIAPPTSHVGELARHLTRVRAEATAAERSAIVAWLREHAFDSADPIEAGEHRQRAAKDGGST